MSDTVESLLKRQKVLADFGEFALGSEDLDEVLHEACRLVGEAMGTGRSKVLEIEPGGESLFLRAGVGWDAGVVGHVHIPMKERSSESFAIEAAAPVLTQDISKEERFDVPLFMKEAGVVALVNVPIFLPGRRAYGLLQVDDTVPRDFDENDTEFLRTYAIILGPVINRLLKVQELRASEERFRLTVEGATDYAIFVTDSQDRITDWLPGAEAVFGWSADEAVGQPGAILFTSEDRERGQPEKEIETARREGYAPNTRWHLRKDGSRVFIEGSVRALQEGAARAFLKIGQDVTEWREEDERLRESEARFRAMFEQSPLMIHIFDPAGRTLVVNPALIRTFGLPAEALQGYNIFDDPQLQEEGARDLLERMFRGEVVRTPPQRHDAAISAGEGRARWVEALGFPVRDAAGALREVVLMTQDITDVQEAQEALRESEARFRLMADAVPQIIWITDPEGRTEFFNKQWTDYTGATYQPTTAADVAASFVHPDDGAATVTAFDEARRTGGTFLVEHRIRSKAGDWRWFLVRGEPYRDPQTGEVARWFGASVDIHDRRLAEAELRASEERLRELNETLEQRVSEALAERNMLAKLVELTDVMVMAVDLDYTILALNAANADEFERIYGVRPKAGDNMLELLAEQPEHQEQVRAGWALGMQDEQVTFVEEFGDPDCTAPGS